MVDYLKIFEKCRDTFCGDIFTKKELETSKNEYTKILDSKKIYKNKDIDTISVDDVYNLI